MLYVSSFAMAAYRQGTTKDASIDENKWVAPGHGAPHVATNYNTCLHLAAGNAEPKNLLRLLANGAQHYIEQKNELNCTPLHCAAESLCPATVYILLNYGAHKIVNTQDVFGRTPLHNFKTRSFQFGKISRPVQGGCHALDRLRRTYWRQGQQ